MTLWNGVSYSSLDINTFLTSYQYHDYFGCVLPGVGNDLRVISSAGGISVLSGAAVIHGLLFVSDSTVSFAISPNTTANTRYDFLVLRKDDYLQTARLMLVEGVNGYTAPYETSRDTTSDMVLATITMPAYTDVLPSYHIKDERIFFSYHSQSENLLTNSEFLAVSQLTVGIPPEAWIYTGAPVAVSSTDITLTSYSSVLKQARGRYITLTTGSLMQTFVFQEGVDANLALTGFVSCTSGTAFIRIELLDQYEGVLGTFKETYIFDSLHTSAHVNCVAHFGGIDRAKYARFTFGSITGAVTFSGFTMCSGYTTDYTLPKSEVIMFKTPVTDANYDGDAKSTSTDTVDLTTDFGGNILIGTLGCYLRVRARDSGSAGAAAGTCYVGIAESSTGVQRRLQLAGVTNDVYRQIQIPVQVDRWVVEGDATPQFYVDMAATGAGTLDVTIEIVGIYV